MPELTEVDVAILGAGTAGLNALRQVKNAGKSFVLIERGDLGTMCARTGCIPSKAVLHASDQMNRSAAEATSLQAANGFAANQLWNDARKTRRESVAGEAEETLKLAEDRLIRGDARIVGPNDIRVGERMIKARAVVLATGSVPTVPAAWKALGERVLTTESLFDLKELPATMGVIGLGAIGLEMGVALSRLGVRVVGADQASTIGGIVDPYVEAIARQHFEQEMTMWLDAAVDMIRTPSGSFQLQTKHADRKSAEVEYVLVALGRRSTLSTLGLQHAGIVVDDEGNVEFDSQTMRIGTLNFYLAGDVSGSRPLQHEAADEGAIAGWNAARHGTGGSWRRRVPLSIAFTNPDFASIGCPFDKLPHDTLVVEGTSDGNARSKIAGAADNVVRLYVDPADGHLIGATVFALAGEHLAHLLAWAVQRRETVESMLQLPFYHPTVEEIIQTALRAAAKKLYAHGALELAPARDR